VKLNALMHKGLLLIAILLLALFALAACEEPEGEIEVEEGIESEGEIGEEEVEVDD
jgi:hypothetical protein